jgi:hypothetical protein
MGKIKIYILGMLLFAVAATGMAQGRTDGQNSVYADFGIVPEHTGNNFAVSAKAGWAKVLGTKGFFGKVGVGYSNYEVGYLNNISIPYQRIHVDVMPGYSYVGLYPLMINGYLGAYGALEVVNHDKKGVEDHAENILEPTTNFTVGFVGTLEFEVNLSKNLSIVADITQYYDINSKFSKAKYAVYGGIKYIFF